VGPPLLPTRYNTDLQIVQSPGYFAIEAEPDPPSRPNHSPGWAAAFDQEHPHWLGDSFGHWEGNTIMIDTANFTDLTPFPVARNLPGIEHITRTDEEALLLQFTVVDTGMWTKPWSGEATIKKLAGKLYESACHQANSGLENSLHEARGVEAEAAAGKSGKVLIRRIWRSFSGACCEGSFHEEFLARREEDF